MPVFLLVRHGENDYVKKGRLAGRLPEVHLNDNGRKQAQAVAEKLAEAPVKAVYASPLERTMETAEPIAKALGLKVIPRPGLIEVDFGEWQDKKLKGLSRLKLWKVVQGAPSRMRFPQGESFAEAQLRVCQELEALAAQHDAKDLVVCVSHSDVIKLAVAYYIGAPLDAFQRLHVAPASITALMLGEASSRLLTLNYEISLTLPKE
ncbi:MAG: histidine phosphatase family protein [Chloroflexota bacterium]